MFIQAFVLIIRVNCVSAGPATDAAGLLWRQPLGGTAMSAPQVQLESVIVLCDDSSVRAFSNEGKTLWEYKSRGRLSPFIARSRTAISFVCGTTGDLTALNRAGRVLWTINLKEKIVAPPLSGWDERIFIFLEKRIVCYTETASLLWQKTLPAALALEPVLDNSGGFITVLEDRTLIAVTAFGKIRTLKLGKMPLAALPLPAKAAARNNGDTFYASGKIALVNSDGTLLLCEYNDDAIEEPGDAAISLPAAPLAAASLGSHTAIQLNNGRLVLLQTEENTMLWSAVSEPGIGAPGNNAQKIRVQFDTGSKNIHVLSISGAAAFTINGEELWSVQIENAAATPSFSDEGILYSSGRDWILYAYRTIETKAGRGLLELPPLGDYGLGKKLSDDKSSELKRISGSDYNFILEIIHDAVTRGNLGEHEPLWTRTLFAIAGDGNVETGMCIEAIRLLGIIGSRETILFLTQQLQNESQTVIRAEIVSALGKIGIDNEGRTFSAFAKIISMRSEIYDDTLYYAIAQAIGNICRFSGPPVSARGIEMLSALTRDSSRLVSQKARDELELLRN
jgi:outer membrane protein assembly factor BamB